MNKSETIAKRMQDAGLPYEITNAETPWFMLSGGDSVVALWRDSHDDTERAFVGFAQTDEIMKAARKVKGVYAVYAVSAKGL